MLCLICRHALEGTARSTSTPRVRLKDSATHTSNCVPNAVIEQFTYGHHLSVDSFYQSVDLNCIICTSLDRAGVQAMKRRLRSEDSSESNFFSTFEVARAENKLIVNVACGGAVHSSTLVPVGEEEYDMNVTFKLDSNTGGPKSGLIIADWVKSCLADHQRCSSVQEPSFLPSRLIRISLVDNLPTYSLVLRAECLPCTRYITLSYVWGKGPAHKKLRLLKTSYDSLRQLTAVSTLPKTYAHAITVATSLGIQHLWIDSLCILQDCMDDWRVEAASMGRVYRNAILTIAALSGVDDNAGLFYNRDIASVAPTVLKMDVLSDNTISLFRHAGEQGGRWSSASFRKDAILLGRAWCYQERLLSPRSLYFGAQQLFWECRERRACEVNPIDASWPPTPRPSQWKDLFSAPDPPLMKDPYLSILQEWYVVVQTYSACSLTMSSDKLVALTGLATETRLALNAAMPQSKHKYLAGIWSSDLRRGICWYKLKFAQRPHPYRSPSWSWASLNGAATGMNPIELRPKCHWFVEKHLCSSWTQNVGGLDTGEVLDGQLTITGPLAVVNVGDTNTSRYETHRPIVSFEHPLSGLQIRYPVSGPSYKAEVAFDTEEDVTAQAYFMPIFLCPEELESPKSFHFVRGVVLVRVNSDEVYKRIGCAILYAETKVVSCNLFKTFEPRTAVIV